MAQLRSKANKERGRQRRKRIFIILPIILVILVSAFLYYAYAARFHIASIVISGNSFVKQEAVEAKIEEILSKKLWGFIPRKSSLLIGKKFVEQELLLEYPAIQSLRVNLERKTIYIDITERKAMSIICTSSSLCYFMDEGGLAFAGAPQFEGSSFIKIKTYESTIGEGRFALAQEQLAEIVAEVAIFKNVDLQIQSIELTTESEMNFIGPNKIIFILNRRDKAVVVEERLKALLSSKSDIGNGSYEYVDLRIDSKIFLKRIES